MADIPIPRSYSQILGDQIDTWVSKTGIEKLKTGAPTLSIFETASQSDMRGSEDIFTLLKAHDLDNAEGQALDNIGNSEDTPRFKQSPASGFVDITDTSFQKVSTTIFQGLSAPIVGTTTVNIVDASGFIAGDGINTKIYIGRGTANYEGPIVYSAKTPVPNANNPIYWTLTLVTATQKFHNLGESVVLAQGGLRTISGSDIVQTAQGNASDAIQFNVLHSASIPDGETTVNDVQVIAQKPGLIGNVPAKAIKEFSSSPFTGAGVVNLQPYTNGKAAEKDDDYRERIRVARQTKTRGTSLAVESYVIGAVSADENKSIISSSFVNREGSTATLYIDDGTGYEEQSTGIATESLEDLALGGEDESQISSDPPITKAYIQCTNSAPFALVTGMKLAVNINGTTTEHTFDASEFHNINNATAYEVVSSINSDSALLWSARTINAGTAVILFAKSDTNEDIAVETASGNDANTVLEFPAGRVYSTRLYKNDILLSKDGKAASITSQSFGSWSTLAGTQTLTIIVDGIKLYFDGAATVGHLPAFTDQDFIDANTGYNTLGQNSLNAWAAVFNHRIPGIKATISSGKLTLSSNRGNTANASVEILTAGSSLVTNGMFLASGGSLKSAGADNDYSLDRNLGQIKLVNSLVAGDKLTLGSTSTRAFLQSDTLSTLNISSPGANLWFSVDGGSSIIASGVTASTALDITVAGVLPWGYRLNVFSSTASSLFSNVKPGDWAVFWDTGFNANLRGHWKVVNATNIDFEIEKASLLTARAGHTITALANGKYLVTGGYSGWNKTGNTASCEIYDPATKTWTAAASMSTARAFHTATLLSNNKVLIVGGLNQGTDNLSALNTCEIYDSTNDTWAAAASITDARHHHTALLLNDSTVLVAGGGAWTGGTIVSSSYRYDSSGNTWSGPYAMGTGRSHHTMTDLGTTHNVIVAGGQGLAGVLASAEKFTLGTLTWGTAGNMFTARQSHRALLKSNGLIYVTGGSTALDSLTDVNSNSTEKYTDGVGWSNDPPAMANPRSHHIFTKLSNGNLVVAFGSQDTGDQVETYDSTFDTWSTGNNPLGTFDRVSPAGIAIGNTVLATGGFGTDSLKTTSASAELYDSPGNAWSQPDANIQLSLLLSSGGLSFLRTDNRLQQITVSSANNYTASSLVDSINTALSGAVATIYRTNQLRVSTNTFNETGGDINLISDTEAQKIKLPQGLVQNLTGHVASVESANSDVGTPDFSMSRVRGSVGTTKPICVLGGGYTSLILPTLNSQFVTLRDIYDTLTDSRWGTNKGFYSTIVSETNDTNLTSFTLTGAVNKNWLVNDRLYFASSYHIAPQDVLTTVIDEDVATKRFVVNMWRKLKPVGPTYGLQNTFKDADNSNSSIAVAFGLTYDFNDYVAYMAARGKTHDGDNNKRILWRYTRLGPDGNLSRVNYILPKAANDSVKVNVDNTTDDTTSISIALKGGAAKTGWAIRNTTRLGFCVTGIVSGMSTAKVILAVQIASASRTANVTTLTLLPDANIPAITDHGFSVNDVVYVKSTSGSFTSGAKTVTVVTSTTIKYAETAADVGSTLNIGTVSFDTVGEVSLSGSSPAVVAGDYLRIDNSTGINSEFIEQTERIDTLAGTSQSFTVNWENATVTSPGLKIKWYPVNNATGIHFFANGNQTATQIAAAVNALAAVTNSAVPIKGTVIGTGTGVITKTSAEEASVYPTWFNLTDGVNYIKTTTAPGSVAGDYQLTFKNSITSSLATNNDWANEEVRVCPITVSKLVEWFNTPTVSGLYTGAGVQSSSNGSKLQFSSLKPGSDGSVQVQGGTANTVTAAVVGSAITTVNPSTYLLVTIPTASGTGLVAGNWVSIDNTTAMPKSVITGTTKLTSITADGIFVFDAGADKVWDFVVAPSLNVMIVPDKQNGFMAYTDTGLGTALATTAVVEGDWVRIIVPATPTGDASHPVISLANTGIFRVVRVSTGADGLKTFWVENPNGIESVPSECDIQFIKFNSVMPGDTVKISTTLWGANNVGNWTVQSVGTSSGIDFVDEWTFKVSTATDSPTVFVPAGGVTLGSDSSLVQVIEAVPTRLIKKILSICPNQTDGSFTDIKLTTSASYGLISGAAGSILTALDKLNFSTDVVQGIDGYKHSTGLIGLANKIIYGDPADTATYPGVAAGGAKINISGPIIRKIQISVAARLRTGISSGDVGDRIKSAIASVVNSVGIGQAISLSDIVTAAGRVSGVVSVVILSPAFGNGNDLINVQPYEKPMILNIDQDVQVSFIGN